MLVPECPSHMDTRGISCVLAAAYEANEWRRALCGNVMPAISAIFLRQRPWRFSYNLSISSGAGSYSAKASQALAAAGSGTKRCFPFLAIEAETNTSSFSSRMASGVILTHSERRSPQKAARTNRNNIPLSCSRAACRSFFSSDGEMMPIWTDSALGASVLSTGLYAIRSLL